MMQAAIPMTPAASQPRSLARIGGVQSAAPQPKQVSEEVQLSLTAYVRGCFDDAKMAREAVTTRMLKCERQRRGEYDPDVLQEIRESGGSEIFMMLTDIKSRAAASWITDVMSGGGGPTFTLDPSPEPDLPEDVRNEVIQTVFAEIQELTAAGMPVADQAVEIRLSELHRQVTEAIQTEARERAVRMERRINDKMAEGGWRETMADLIDDFVTFPTAVFKGPFMQNKLGMHWGPNWTPVVGNKMAHAWRRVSPYNIFPSPGSSGPDDGYICERHILSRQDLQSYIGQPGYNDAEIKRLLERFDDANVRSWINGDTQKDDIDGKTHNWYARNQIEAVEFWGPVSGMRLKQWGMKGLDEYKDYEANVWVIAGHCIRAVLNADPLGRRPYSTASFVRIPGAFWGKALPELMADVQRMCNAAARALANNMGMASGPMVEVTIDRMAKGAPLDGIYPWKQFQVTSDKTGGGQQAVRFYQPDMHADKLLQIYTYFQKVADEVTGVPNYIYGSTQVGGAGRTASGLAMLMENAAKGIKHAILFIDAAKSRSVLRMFEWLMIYDPDQSIKGDMRVVPAGIVAALMKEGLHERRQQFLQATANPFDIEIMGLPGRAAVLRETAKTLDMDVDDVVPDPRAMKRQMLQNQMMQAAAQQAAQQPPPGQPQQSTAQPVDPTLSA